MIRLPAYLALAVFAVAAWFAVNALWQHNAIDRERLDADLVTSYEAANVVMDLYGKIATLNGYQDLLGKAEAYMAQRGVLKGWRPIKAAAVRAQAQERQRETERAR